MSKERLEAVAAFIITHDLTHDQKHHLFLGASHTNSKEVSAKIGDGLQLSIFTETKLAGESDQSAINRLLAEEEIHIDGLSPSDFEHTTHLCTSLVKSRRAEAVLYTYLFCVDKNTKVEIIDGELAEVGWAPFDTVLEAPAGSWWIRFGYEAITSYQHWRQNPASFKPDFYPDLRHSVPRCVFEEIEKHGVSAAEALYRLGLYSPQQPRPWSFVH